MFLTKGTMDLKELLWAWKETRVPICQRWQLESVSASSFAVAHITWQFQVSGRQSLGPSAPTLDMGCVSILALFWLLLKIPLARNFLSPSFRLTLRRMRLVPGVHRALLRVLGFEALIRSRAFGPSGRGGGWRGEEPERFEEPKESQEEVVSVCLCVCFLGASFRRQDPRKR